MLFSLKENLNYDFSWLFTNFNKDLGFSLTENFLTFPWSWKNIVFPDFFLTVTLTLTLLSPMQILLFAFISQIHWKLWMPQFQAWIIIPETWACFSLGPLSSMLWTACELILCRVCWWLEREPVHLWNWLEAWDS